MRESSTLAVVLSPLLALLLIASPVGATSFNLARIAGRNTPMPPDGTGTFESFGVPVVSGGNVAFLGYGFGSGQQGIYLFDGSSLSRVADLNTAIPNGTGNFTSIGNAVLSGGNVAFFGVGSSGQQGIYLFDGSSLSRVADQNTPIPEGTSTFESFGEPVLSGGNVAFEGFAFGSGQRGIYLFDGSTLSRVVDLNTVIPNGTGNFTNIFNAVLSGANVAFFGSGTPGQQGIYLFDGSSLSRVADLNTAIPNGSGTFQGFFPLPVLSGGNVVFLGFGSIGQFGIPGQQGIYLFDGSTLRRVADLNTAIPNDTGTFQNFRDPVFSGANVAFFGSGTPGQQGIYLFDGALSRVVDRNTAIPDGIDTFTSFSMTPVLSGANVAFFGSGSISQAGIYLFDGALSRVADRNTAIPDGTGTFLFFSDPTGSTQGRAWLSGGNVAFQGFGNSGVGIYLATPTPSGRLWVGLRNSDDVGTAFDLRVELYKNATLVASGLTRCIRGLARPSASAQQIQVAFDPFAPVPLQAADVLSLKILTRVGTNPDNTRCTGTGASHASATGLRLYYDAAARASRFGVTIGGDTGDVFLHSNGGACTSAQSAGVTIRSLDGTAPTATSIKCKDSGSVKFSGGNLWKEIATWSMAPEP